MFQEHRLISSGWGEAWECPSWDLKRPGLVARHRHAAGERGRQRGRGPLWQRRATCGYAMAGSHLPHRGCVRPHGCGASASSSKSSRQTSPPSLVADTRSHSLALQKPTSCSFLQHKLPARGPSSQPLLFNKAKCRVLHLGLNTYNACTLLIPKLTLLTASLEVACGCVAPCSDTK